MLGVLVMYIFCAYYGTDLRFISISSTKFEIKILQVKYTYIFFFQIIVKNGAIIRPESQIQI